MERLGTGIGWRPEIADAVESMPGIDWVEVVAENVCPGHLPESLLRLRERGVTVVPHGVSLGLGGADRPDEGRLTALAERAGALGSPLVTEHIAFVRAGGPLTASPRLEAGHLLPVPRTRDALDVLCENVRIAQDALPVPLAVENIAALVSWPGEELTEGQFLYELADRTGVRLLVDVANLHTNHVNRGEDPAKALAELPLEAIAYVHVAGGFERDGVWHDSHAHPVPRPVLDILADLAARTTPPGVLLERDENFPEPAELERELAEIRRALRADRATDPTGTGAVPPHRNGTDTSRTPHRNGTDTSRTPDRNSTDTSRTAERHGTDASRTPDQDGTDTSRTPDRNSTDTSRTAERHGTDASRTPDQDGTDTSRTPDQDGTDTSRTPHRNGTDTSRTAERHGTDASRTPDQDGTDTSRTPDQDGTDADRAPGSGARERVGLAQAALLSALVAGTPVPEGFDRVRVRVQARALAGKRADVVAKVAPELPVILGDGYRAAFLGYAQRHPMTGGYRHDALAFAAHLLDGDEPRSVRARRELREWWLDRSGPAPRDRTRPHARLARATRRVLLRR